MDHRFPSIEMFKSFAFAGNATFTIVNENKGSRLTFKFRQPKKEENKPTPTFVSVLNGSDNTSDYAFLGTIWGENTYRHGRNSHIGVDAPSARTAQWLLQHVVHARQLPSGVYIMHNGHCGKCGRILTVPESIVSGLGPVCAGA